MHFSELYGEKSLKRSPAILYSCYLSFKTHSSQSQSCDTIPSRKQILLFNTSHLCVSGVVGVGGKDRLDQTVDIGPQGEVLLFGTLQYGRHTVGWGSY
jgi:hypothetical protein